MSIRPLSQDLQKKAIAELNEVPSRLFDDLEYVREWIKQQTHLNARTEDQWLLGFLRPCKFSLQKTKEKLDYYYTLRNVFLYYFRHREPFSLDVKIFCKSRSFVILPEESNPLAPRRVLIIARNGNPDELTIKMGIKIILMLADIHLYENDACIINGQEAIFDVKDVPLKYFGQWTPSVTKDIAFLLLRAYPARLKGVHVINVHPLVYPIVNTFKSLIPRKLRDRIHVYPDNDFDSLYKSIPREVFPEEYGGNAGSLSELAQKMKLKLESYKEWFHEDAQYFSDESKRPGKSIVSNEVFDMEGSFRKLEID